jgi:hypothetical protein
MAMRDATFLLRLYAKWRLARLAALDPARAQENTLRALLRRARETAFGRAHDFGEISDVPGYQNRVKLRRYEAFWSDWWSHPFPRLDNVGWPENIPYFANSSGTTKATTKRIPVSKAMLRSNRRAALDVLVHHVAHHPDSAVLSGRSLMLGGSTAFETLAPGVHAGDLSGIAAAEVPFYAREKTFPSRDVALLSDWGEKIATIAPASLTEKITCVTGTPSWMLLFFEQVSALRGGALLAGCYPALELIVHGGVGFAPYRQRISHWLKGSRATTREVYAASEGFFAVADRGDGDGLRLILDNGLFYEFVRPAALDAPAPDRRWIANADLGVEYALVVSSNAGLWSYVVGDTVMLVDKNPPRVLVTGRTSWSLSIVGEHLIGAELDDGVATAARASGVTVADYAAAGLPPDAADARAGHLFVVELTVGDQGDATKFARALDRRLAALNADYAAHRADDVGMRPPSVRLVPSGTFAAWMAARGKLGGQNKVPRVIGDPAMVADLLARVGRHREY